MSQAPSFDILSIVTAGDGSKQWVEVRVKIERGFDFTSKTDVDRMVRSLRSASNLLLRGSETDE